MEVSSGEEYYIASDNTGTPLAVFSSNGQMIKQVTNKAPVAKVTLSAEFKACFFFSYKKNNHTSSSELQLQRLQNKCS